MPQPGEIVEIDLNQEDLFGWESRKSDLVIDALVRAIESGAKIPPIYVYSTERGFFLAPAIEDTRVRLSDGGHNRAVAHFIAGKPLKAEVLYGGEPYEYDPINIRDIQIVDDSGQLARRQKFDPNYAETFQNKK
jgi:hypothetical protein